MKKSLPVNKKDKSIRAVWPASFMDDENVNFIKNLATALPKDTLYCLELHSTNKADFLFCISPAIKDLFFSLPPDKNHTIKKIVEKWSSNELLIEHIRNVWITIDYIKDSISDPWPYVLLHQHRLGTEIQKLILYKIIQSVWQMPIPAQTTLIDQAIDALPPPSYLFGLSAEVRKDKRIRLILGNIKPANILSYLQGLNWQGPSALLSDLCAALDHRLWYSILLDFTDTILPAIGIEIWFEPARSKGQALLLIQSLVEKKIIPAPDSIIPLIESIIVTENQWINHLKIQISNQHGFEIKTYLFYKN